MSSSGVHRNGMGLSQVLWPRALARLLLVVVHLVVLTLIGTGALCAAVEGRTRGNVPHLPTLGIAAPSRIAPPPKGARSVTIACVQPLVRDFAASEDQPKHEHAAGRIVSIHALLQARHCGPPPPAQSGISKPRPWQDWAAVQLLCHRTVVLNL